MGGRGRAVGGRHDRELWPELSLQIAFTDFPLADILPEL